MVTIQVEDDCISCRLPLGHRGEHRGFNLKGDRGMIWQPDDGWHGGMGWGKRAGEGKGSELRRDLAYLAECTLPLEECPPCQDRAARLVAVLSGRAGEPPTPDEGETCDECGRTDVLEPTNNPEDGTPLCPTCAVAWAISEPPPPTPDEYERAAIGEWEWSYREAWPDPAIPMLDWSEVPANMKAMHRGKARAALDAARQEGER
jgi:hypothetical protein